MKQSSRTFPCAGCLKSSQSLSLTDTAARSCCTTNDKNAGLAPTLPFDDTHNRAGLRSGFVGSSFCESVKRKEREALCVHIPRQGKGMQN